MKTISNIDFQNKKVLIRVDFNVPLNEEFVVTDNTRIKAAIPTIQKVIQSGGSVILMSHLGRPKSGPEDKFSLRHIVSELEILRSEEHTSELQSRPHLVCRLLLEKKKNKQIKNISRPYIIFK